MKFKEEKLGSYYVCAFVFKELDTYYISHTLHLYISFKHELRTHREKIAFNARLKIQSQSQIFRCSQSIFCLPHWPNFSDIFDLCLHWVSVVRAFMQQKSF